MSQKKNILVLCDWFEPGYKAGGPIRSVANLVYRLGKEYNFYVLTSDRDFGADQAYPNIPLEKWLLHEKFQIKYVPTSWMNSPHLLLEIDELNIDVVYMNSLFSKAFTLTPLLALRRWQGKKVLAPRGMLGKGSLEVKSIKKKLFLTFAKKFKLFNNIHWHATNEGEQKEIESMFENQEVTVASNMGRMPDFSLEQKKKKASAKLNVVFFARISPIKNLQFCLEVLQRTQPLGEIIFTVIGPIEDQVYWQSCLEIDLPEHVKLNYIGQMNPYELAEQMPRFDILFLPTKNENFGHSIVEAWSYGIPVLISDCTPWHNLENSGVGADFSLDEKESFIHYINRLVAMDENEYFELASQSLEHARGIIENPEIEAQYQQLFS